MHREGLAQVRERVAAREHGRPLAADLGQPPVDPRAQLAHRLLGGALWRPPREHHLHGAAAVDRDPHPAGAVGATDAVGEHDSWSAGGDTTGKGTVQSRHALHP